MQETDYLPSKPLSTVNTSPKVAGAGFSSNGGFATNSGFFARAGFWLLCFITPIAMLCIVLAILGIYPFGAESFLTEDLKYQYIDFYHWFYRVLCGEESIFYSTACGLGANTWGLYTYYLASPFNLLMLLFGEDHITFSVFVACALKLGCMQLSAVFYLRRRFKLSAGMAFVVALGYTLCVWVAWNLRNPMWLDSLILLPLIMWAVWLLVSRGRILPLTLLTALNIMVCWYTAYMTVLFCIMLTILEWSCAKNNPANNQASKNSQNSCSLCKLALRFALPMVEALLLSAWMFIPTVLGMAEDGADASSSLPDIMMKIFSAISAGSLESLSESLLTTQPLLIRLVYGLMPFKYDFTAAYPQLYCGILLLLAFVMFFISRKVECHTKKAVAVFVLVMLISISLTPLQAIWCGFRAPSGFYSRPCIFVSPTLIWIASFWLMSLQGNKQTQQAEGVTHNGKHNGVHSGTQKFEHFNQTVTRIEATITRAVKKKQTLVALSIFVFADLTLSTYFATNELHQQFNYSQEYNDTYYEQSVNQTSWLKEHDPTTWRMERTFARAGASALNEAMACNYIGLSSYSSVHNQQAIDFLNNLGYSQTGRMHTRYAKSIIATDALLGLKYTTSKTRPAALNEVEGMPLLQGANTYKNPYALSLGYAVSSNAVGAELQGNNPFERQNSFASALAGRDVQLYKRADTTLATSTTEEKTWQAYIPANCLGYTYVGRYDEIKTTADSNKAVYLAIDNNEPEREVWRFQNSLITLGDVEGSTGGEHTIKVTATSNATNGILDLNYVDCDTYYLDLSVLDELISELSNQQVNFTQFSGMGISGTLDAESDEWVMISVPHEDGWTVTVNGENVDAKSAYAGALTLIPIHAGENTIEMHFVSPGFYIGCAVSALGVLLVVIMFVLSRRNKDANVHASQLSKHLR